MRQKLQDLQSPALTTPLSTPVSTFAPQGLSVLGTAPVAPELINVSKLSNAAKELITERAEFNQDALQSLGARAAELQRAGKTDEEIIAELSDSGDTPRRIASKFAKLAESGRIDEVDNPYFLLGLEESRGRFVANQAAEVAQDLEDSYAAKLGLLPVGDEAGRAQVITEALSQVRDGIQDSLGLLGPVGTRAAEERLASVGDQFVANLQGKARSIRLDEYKDKAGIEVTKLAKIYEQAAGNTELRQYAIDGYGELYGRLKLEGKVDPESFLQEKIVAAAGSIQQAEGWAAAAEFLEDTYLNTKEPSGNRVFATRPSVELLEGLRVAEYRAEQESKERPQKLAEERRGAYESMQQSELYSAMASAANEGPDAVRQVANNLRELLAEGSPEALARMGLDADTAIYGAAFINQLETDTLQTSRTFQAADVESTRNQVLGTYLEQGASTALASVRASGLPAVEQLRLSEQIKGLEESNSQRYWSMVNQTGVMGRIRGSVAASFPEGTPEFLVERAVRQAQDSLTERFASAGFSDENPLTGPAAVQWANSFLDDYEKANPSVQDFGTGLDTSADTDPREAAEGLRQTQDKLQASANTLAGTYTSVVGGIPIAQASPELQEFEEYLAVTPGKELLKFYGPRNSVRKRIEAIASEVPDDLRDAALTESFMRLGLLNTGDLITGDIESIKTAVADRLAATGPLGRQGSGSKNRTSLEAALSGMEDLDFSSINPFTVRMPEFEEDPGYLMLDPVDGDSIRWNPQVPMDDNLFEAISNLLEETGVPATQDTIKEFIFIQRRLWD